MIKKYLSSKRGEAYIDVVIGLLVVVVFMVLMLNIFSFVTLKTHMDRIAEDLLDVATFTGEFGDEFDAKITELKTKHGDFEVAIYADTYFNSTLKQVQLGDVMVVQVTVKTYVAGMGTAIPLTLTVERTGKSENYWK